MNSEKGLLLACQLDNYSNRKDKSVSIRFITQEQTPEGIMKIHQLLDKFGSLYFSPSDTLTRSEMDELDSLDVDIMEGAKSQSQRLKAVLWINWQQKSEGFLEFKDYYKSKTEKIIQFYKDKLE